MLSTFARDMMQFPDILKTVFKTESEPLLDVYFEKEQHIPGSINYTITRHLSETSLIAEDTGLLYYHINTADHESSYLQLSFCVTGNKSLSDKNQTLSKNNLDVFHFHFTSTFLNQFVQNIKLSNRKDEVLAFKHPLSFTKFFPLCNRKRSVLEALLTHGYSGAMENVFVNAKVHELLLYSVECLVDEREDGFACRFPGR